jgi:DNA-binding MarR family transcriptional regulator
MELADSLRLAVGRLARRLRQQAQGGLTPSQRSVLATLETSGPLRMGDLARIENVSPPSVTGIVGRLEDRAMVRRVPDPDDARSTMVEATELAIADLQESRRVRSTYLAEHLNRLDDAERTLLREAVVLLHRMIEE